MDGSYAYPSPAGLVTLVLQQQGNVVTGTMWGADGNVFQLNGTPNPQGARGQIGSVDGWAYFSAGVLNGGLHLVVAEVDPRSGQPDFANGWQIDFTRTAAVAGSPFASAFGVAPGVAPGGQRGIPGFQPGFQDPAVELDSNVVGYWTFNAPATRLQLDLSPDGTYAYGAGDELLGATGGDVVQGWWRTQYGVIYLRETYGPQWVPFARYSVQCTSMMLTFDDGTRQLWQR